MILLGKHVLPMPPAMWLSSYCYSLVERVLPGRLSRTLSLAQLLPVNYQPSELQLDTPHSTIIDWIALSPLRD